ncbi:hypothetical protein PsorP6_003072 [Peronosclerospora sorghi]|uniref:Uncharacterized protein n=1 Tax=Peronosclerospora sorghi TaxID=230839 RepID=A0ACC0VLL4_9STRA|nr:hypothetical protein PsorP6_003072 [Peronosclerospora sorghi]
MNSAEHLTYFWVSSPAYSNRHAQLLVVKGGERSKQLPVGLHAPGARVATGSTDYRVKLWDFAGMVRHVLPFREIQVEEGYPLVAVSKCTSGNRLLAVTGYSQPKVLC